MRIKARTAAAAALVTAVAAALVLSLAGCGARSDDRADGSGGSVGKDVIAPVTMTVNELQGKTVGLVAGQVLNIDTGDLSVDSYEGEVSKPDVAEFTPGRRESAAQFNPGVTALAPGSTEVTMTNEQGGIQPLSFTVEVSARE
ncbi:hypothetical protein [Leucobacter sp. wl10]|uniref:hypothetical protein n=1 Tax=Leucobacter sp. wl10 TaxID=2304677 RepID=UPI000E5B66E9|nr:hypothetical protein [Leucobacter sp. wl10]RGE19806.1 hypothetical protein D1J51_10575 [Leucobacter sp. wl10]